MKLQLLPLICFLIIEASAFEKPEDVADTIKKVISVSYKQINKGSDESFSSIPSWSQGRDSFNNFYFIGGLISKSSFITDVQNSLLKELKSKKIKIYDKTIRADGVNSIGLLISTENVICDLIIVSVENDDGKISMTFTLRSTSIKINEN